MIRFAAAALAVATVAGHAATPSPPPSPPPAIGFGAMLQVTFSLMLVVAAIFAVAWVARRLSLGPMASHGILKMRGGLMLGPKERLVVVEVQGRWLVLGVTAQHIALLHDCPRPEDDAAADTATALTPFAARLQQFLSKKASP